jgi:hypothetical protein
VDRGEAEVGVVGIVERIGPTRPVACTRPTVDNQYQRRSRRLTGTFEPIPLSESNRLVLSLDAQSQPLLFNSTVDYLNLDVSVDLGQRGPDATQADRSRWAAGTRSQTSVN